MAKHALMHPFSEVGKPETDYINIVSAKGSTLTDDKGKTYIDGMASLWYCQVGHGRPEMIEAITAQLNTLATYNIFDPFTNDQAREAADLIASKSPFTDGRVFLGCSGSEAVDTALKLARMTQQRRNKPDKQIIIRRTHGYHGTNFGGTTSQGIAPNRDGWGDLVPHFVEVSNDNIEEAASVFAEHGDRVAAVITEPVQGAGGVWPPPEGYLEGLRRLCDDNGALLIFDEVICGFGRTGSWFASQTYGVSPDLITFAKGVTSGYQPLSGVIVAPHVVDDLTEPGFLLRHGYTYSGHPVASAAAIANINLIESEGLVDRANHIGQRTEAGLSALASDGVIESYRGVGAVWAADIGRDSTATKFAMLDKGVFCRGVANSVIWCPPLVVTDAEIDTFVEVFHDVVSAGDRTS